MSLVNLGNRVSNQYVLNTPKGWLAIDTGYAGGFQRYCRQLQIHGLSPADISMVLLTHAHDDHAGFLGELLAATQAQLLLHPLASERLQVGHNLWIGGCSGLQAKIFVKAMALAGKARHEFPPVKVSDSALLWDGVSQPLLDQGIPLQILALPGHTADSIGLLTEDGNLFCGDAAMNNFPSLKRTIIWIEDLDAYRASWDIMIQSGAKMIYPSHGKPFPAEDLKRYRSHLKKIVLR